MAQVVGGRILSSPFPDENIPDNVTVHQLVLDAARRYADRKAIIDAVTGRSLTFKQLVQEVGILANSFYKLGLRKGVVVCLYSPNVFEYPLVLHAVLSNGGVLTTCNPNYTADELKYQLVDSKAEYIVTVPDCLDRVQSALKTLNLKKMIVIGGQEESLHCIPYSRLRDPTAPPHPPVDIDPRKDIAVLPYSSGTTGRSKGVILTHYNLVAIMCQLRVFIQLKDNDVFGCMLPMFHIYGIFLYTLYTFYNGVPFTFLSRFDLRDYLSMIQKYKVTHLHLVPPVAVALAKSPLVGEYDLSSVSYINSGAAPFGREPAQEVENRIGVPVVQGYGMTETAALISASPLDNWRHGSVGLLFPNTQLKIVSTDTGEILGPNQDGEIAVRGPQVMLGYLNRPDADKDTLKGGWLFTGDLGHYDEEGFIFIADRKKELIKYKGFQVAPAELESLLLSHPEIADAAVIGVDDPMAGELPKAFVVKKAYSNLTQGQVVQFVGEHVSNHKQLRGGVEFVAEIPKSASGKILRRILKLQANKPPQAKL